MSGEPLIFKTLSPLNVGSEKLSCKFRCNINDEESFSTWLKDFSLKTKTRWLMRSSVSVEKSSFAFSRDYICNHSSYKKTSKGPATATLKDKNCKASLKIRIKRNTRYTRCRDPFVKEGLCAILTIDFKHSHSLDVTDGWRWLKRTDETRSAFIEYFNNGFKPAAAIRFHEGILSAEGASLADASVNPPKHWVYYLHSIWKKNKNSAKSEDKRLFNLKFGEQIQVESTNPTAITNFKTWASEVLKDGMEFDEQIKPTELSAETCCETETLECSKNNLIFDSQIKVEPAEISAETCWETETLEYSENNFIFDSQIKVEPSELSAETCCETETLECSKNNLIFDSQIKVEPSELSAETWCETETLECSKNNLIFDSQIKVEPAEPRTIMYCKIKIPECSKNSTKFDEQIKVEPTEPTTMMYSGTGAPEYLKDNMKFVELIKVEPTAW